MQKPAISQYPRSTKEHGNVMGYSVRTELWRATFWRKRNSAEIIHIELYDQANDAAETVNLAERPEHAELLAGLKRYLPAVGSDLQPPKMVGQKSGKPKAAANDETRDERFERLYPGKAQLTLDEYLSKQGGNQETAKARFTKMDRNNDGLLTKSEFLQPGK